VSAFVGGTLVVIILSKSEINKDAAASICSTFIDIIIRSKSQRDSRTVDCIYSKNIVLTPSNSCQSRFRWPRDQRHGSAAAHLLGLRVRFPQGTWLPFSCECWVLSGRCLCDELITHPRIATDCRASFCVISKPPRPTTFVES